MAHAFARAGAAFGMGCVLIHSPEQKRTYATKRAANLALSGFASAVILLMVTGFMIYEAIEHFIKPEVVVTKESFFVAFFSLLVNAVSAYVLHREEEKMDLTLKAAYIHVLSDVVLSCMALLSLSAIYFANIIWLDPLLGLVGSAVILRWSIGLISKSWREALS